LAKGRNTFRKMCTDPYSR